MSTPEPTGRPRHRRRPLRLAAAGAIGAVGLLLQAGAGAARPGPLLAPAEASTATPRLGHAITPAEAARSGLNVYPDGRGLPPGRGSVAQGAVLFEQKCAACHGERGRGASAEELAGGTGPLTDPTADKTVGLYWPYATTLFDFTRRAMPMDAPGSLSADEVYAITAYVLHENGILAADAVLDGISLPKVRMPNRDGFFAVDAPLHRPR